ncbi:N-acetylglucosamine-6-phosphate deacetylase [Pseudomonas aeruginosa]|nr:N-acetylglucosamine-6-phosphate deacetylase [Pseudomonas aeruginosa]
MLEGNILTPQGWVLGRLHIQDGRIQRIEGEPCDPAGNADPYLLPGFIDLHVHGGGGRDIMEAATPSPPSPAPTGASARPRCWPPP